MPAIGVAMMHDFCICAAPVQAVVGDSPVEAVLYAPSLRYLLVVLEPGSLNGTPDSGNEALLSVRPDFRRMEAAHSGGQVAGVIVTAQGGCQPREEGRIEAQIQGGGKDRVGRPTPLLCTPDAMCGRLLPSSEPVSWERMACCLRLLPSRSTQPHQAKQQICVLEFP
jgi:hypothetical protein